MTILSRQPSNELLAGPQSALDRVREVYLGLAVTATWEVTGIDVSSWQGTMNWDTAAPLVNFAFLRAGSGNDVVDVQYHRNRDECARLNIPFGLYWYVKPDKSWERHGDTIAAVVNASGARLPYVLDVETSGGLGKTALESWLYKLVGRCITFTGMEPMIYTSAGFWNTNMPLTAWAKNLRLWAAHWTAAAAPIIPNDWAGANNPRTWHFWQWSADGNGQGSYYGAQSHSIDLNRYHWSAVEFAAEFGTVVVPPPPPEPEPTEIAPLYQASVTATALNVRAAPSAASTDIGTLKSGDVIPVVEEQGDWARVNGWVHKGYIRRV